MAVTCDNKQPAATRKQTRQKIRLVALDLLANDEWYDAAKVLPEDPAPVLIVVNGVYYKAVYNRKKNLFRADEELRETLFRVKENRILWKYMTRNN
jgi:hypothetical protein